MSTALNCFLLFFSNILVDLEKHLFVDIRIFGIKNAVVVGDGTTSCEQEYHRYQKKSRFHITKLYHCFRRTAVLETTQWAVDVQYVGQLQSDGSEDCLQIQ